MFLSRKLLRKNNLDIWPGFVDALATLLIVMIFALMTFVVSQYYLTDALTGRNQALEQLSAKINSLSTTLKNEQSLKDLAHTKIETLESMLAKLREKLGITQSDLETTKKHVKDEQAQKESALNRITSLTTEIATLEEQIKKIAAALEASEANTEQLKQTHESIAQQLNQQLLEKIKQLEQLNADLLVLQGENKDLKSTNTKLNEKVKGSIGLFRSEFFANLRKVIGNRDDIRIVGDRFVFQSEVLFAAGSAELGEKGKEDLGKLARSLLEISQKIPKDIHWILRVDGHTDPIPIKTAQFPSNWELSSARAIAVVKHLIQAGVSPKNLVAAGFGEFNPLTDSDSDEDRARNRRIEFKLDQK